MLTLCNLCVICKLNRFYSLIFKLLVIPVMIVHTLKMSTGIAGPEQSMVMLMLSSDNFLMLILNHNSITLKEKLTGTLKTANSLLQPKKL